MQFNVWLLGGETSTSFLLVKVKFITDFSHFHPFHFLFTLASIDRTITVCFNCPALTFAVDVTKL